MSRAFRTASHLLAFLALLVPLSVTAQEAKSLADHAGWIAAVTFSPDGKLLATASADRTVKLRDVDSGKVKATLTGHEDSVVAVAFAPDGRTLATGSFDGTARLWDLDTRRVRHTLTGHRGAVQAVAFSPDGARLATGGVDATIRIHDVAEGRETGHITRHKTWVNALAWTRDGKRLVSGSSDGTVRLWNTATLEEAASFDVAKLGEVRSVAISPDGRTVAAGVRYGTVKFWDVPTSKERTLKSHMSDVWGVAFTPDGKYLASGDGDWNRPGTVKLHDVVTGQERAALKTTGEVLCVAISPDGRHLAAGCWDKTVHRWNLAELLAGAPPKTRPNIVFILADDQRFDTIRALGNKEIQTPNLDKLVERGFVFHNTWCQGGLVPAVCTPSRTMLLSGRSLFRIPNPAAKTWDGPTLGGVFRKAGYATLHVGKRGNSFLAGMEAFEKVVYSHGVKGQGASQEDQARFVAEEAIRFLRAQKDDKPFLIYLAPHCPHDPRVAPKRFMDLYDPARLSLPKNFMPRHPFDNGELEVRDEKLAPIPRTPADMKRHLADYYGSISCLDHHVGRILDTLVETGQAKNTVVVYTSDQGLAVGGRHGLMGKQNLYEHFKSPLIVAGPGVAHGQSQALVYLFDLFPTVCALTGVATPKELEGSSLVPVIQGTKPRVREWLFAAYRDCQRMVRDERWKLIWYPKIDRYQLFDLANDPWEIDDLAAKPEQAERLGQMKKRLAEQQKFWGDKRVAAPK